MIFDLSNFTPSDYAAWWGAVIATSALIWNIVISYRAGARLHVTAMLGMKIFPLAPNEEDKTYILVNAVNIGSSATTITHFLGYSADTFLDSLRHKKRKYFIVNGTKDSLPIPYKLSPGDEWKGMADQTLILSGFNAKYFYLGVAHNQQKKSIYKRVRLSA
jgi:hypothetical protein